MYRMLAYVRVAFLSQVHTFKLNTSQLVQYPSPFVLGITYFVSRNWHEKNLHTIYSLETDAPCLCKQEVDMTDRQGTTHPDNASDQILNQSRHWSQEIFKENDGHTSEKLYAQLTKRRGIKHPKPNFDMFRLK